jgi:taurine dioxygenase
LTPNCGSQVLGVHVNDLTDNELEAVKSAVTNRCVVIIPNQFVNPADQLRFAGRLGEVMLPGHTPSLEGAPGVMQLHNNFLQEAPENQTNNWHADATHMARPPSFTMLSCEQPAPLGGDTMWSNQYLAYDTLSETMKGMIRGRRLGFVVAAYYRQFRKPDDPIETYHPLVRVHGDTGRKSVFISDRRLISKIEGMTEEESKPITDYLHRHSYTPEFVYRHRWRKGDLVIWDNRCSLHYAVRDYDPKSTRTMNRLMIAGEAPIGE